MRIPLITPLASRNGTVEKDEKLVNCYGEQDAVTKETRVIKRAGLDEGNAVLTGPDIYGQGLFNYDGYWFAILGDTVFWYDINFTWGGQQAFGSVGFWSSGDTYDIGDAVYYDGVKYYSYSDSNTGTDPGTNPLLWGTTPPPATRYYGAGFSTTGPNAATQSAAAEALWVIAPVLKSCPGDYDPTTWFTGYTIIGGTLIYGDQYGTAGTRTCGNPANGPFPTHAGTIYTV